MSMAEVREVVPTLNTRSFSGRVVINPPEKMAAPLELHTVDQIRLCCNRAFLTFDSYLKHKEESPSCSPGIILEPITQDETEDDDEEGGLFPVIQSVSSVPEEEGFEIEDTEITLTDYDADAPVISDALKRLCFTPVKRRLNVPSWARQNVRQNASVVSINEELELGVEEHENNPDGDAPSHNDVEDRDIDDHELFQEFATAKKDAKRTYNCKIEGCSYSSAGSKTLRKHSQSSHDPTAKFCCNRCPCRFATKDRLDFHLLRVHDEVAELDDRYTAMIINNRLRYSCRFCSYLTPSVAQVKKHIWGAHESNGKFQCKLCCCRYSKPTGLKQHMRLAHSVQVENTERIASEGPTFRTVIVGGRTRYKCTSCGYSTPIKVTIKNHLERVHNRSGEFSCKNCPNRFSTKAKLNQHVQLNHNLKASIGISSKETQKLPIPITSVMVNGSRRYTCPDCKFYTNGIGAINRHLQTAHNPAAIFLCRLCSCRYMTKKHLNRHVVVTHIIQDQLRNGVVDRSEIAEYKVVTIKGYKRYKCQSCKDVKKSEIEMAKHVQRSHVPDGQFPCPLCCCRFARMGGLTLHMNLRHPPKTAQSSKTESVVMNGSSTKVMKGRVKYFKCQLCSYRNRRQIYIKMHLKSAHVPDGRFPCRFCSCCYSYNANLAKHVRRYHPNDTGDVSITAATFETSYADVKPSSIQKETMTYSCDVKACSYSCNDIRSIRFHKQQAHDSNGKFACRFCSCRYEKSISLTYHLIRQHGIRQEKLSPQRNKIKHFRRFVQVIQDGRIFYKCCTKGCVYRTNTRTQIKWHVEHSHSQERKFLCPWCSCRFASDGNRFKEHCSEHHPAESTSNPVSSNQPINESRITLAEKTLERKPLVNASVRKCPIKGCTTFIRADHFTNKIKGHLLRAHSPEAQFKCTLCPCRYHGLKGLKIHFTVAHGKSKVDSKINGLRDEKVENKPYEVQNQFKQKESENSYGPKSKCDKCSYVTHKWALINHKKVAHVQGGSHKCIRCTCRFASHLGLTVHLFKIHGERKSNVGVTTTEASTVVKDVKSVLRKNPVPVLKRLQPVKSLEAVSSTNSSAQISKTKKMYPCHLCDRTFPNMVTKNWHFKCAHSKWTSNVKRYPCDLCPNVYDSEGGLKIHKTKAHGHFLRTGGFPSSPEKEKIKSEPLELRTRNSPRNEDKNSILSALSLFPCSKCEFATQDKKAFEDHNAGSHVPNGMKCVWCSCTFSTKMGLVLHQMAQHPNSFDTTGVNWFQRKTGVTKAGTKTSVDDESDSNPVDENDTDQVSDKEDEADEHESQVSDLSSDVSKPAKKTKPLFQCLKCSYTAKLKMNLDSHKIICHYENGFDCDECPCSFASEKGVIVHKRKSHYKPQRSDSTPKVQQNVIQKCTSCLMLFPNLTRAGFVSHQKLCKRLTSTNNLRTVKLNQRMKRMERLKNQILGLKSTENIETVIDGQNISSPSRKRNEENTNIQDTTPETSLRDLDYPDSAKKNTVTVKKSFSPKSRPMPCSICRTICRGPEKLKIHMQTHTEKTDAEVSIDSVNDSVVSDGKNSSLSWTSEYHKCDECACIFKTETELSDHKKIQHLNDEKIETSSDHENEDIGKEYDYDEVEQEDESKIFKCNLCEYSTEILNNIHSHFQTSHTNGSFSCEICSCVFQTRMNLFYHKSYFHPGNVMGKEGESDPKESILLIGYAVNGVLQCVFCLHSCKLVVDLETHYINSHEDQKPEDISDVDKIAILQIAGTEGAERVCMPKKRLSDEKYVVRKIHSCGAAFSDLFDSIECKICHQKFKKSHELKHMLLCHSAMKTAARCKHCPCRYSSKSALQKHVAWSHKLKSSGDVGSVVKDSVNPPPKKLFKCQKCGLRFALEAGLDVHQGVSHTAGKHVCVICSCSLPTLFGLDGHMAGAHQVTRNILMPVYQEKNEESNEKGKLLADKTVDSSDAEMEMQNDSPREVDESGSSHSPSPLFFNSCASPLEDSSQNDPEISTMSSNCSGPHCEDIPKSKESHVPDRPPKRKTADNSKSNCRSLMSIQLRHPTSELQGGENNSKTLESIKRKRVEKIRSIVGRVSPKKCIESASELPSTKMSPSKRSRSGNTLQHSKSDQGKSYTSEIPQAELDNTEMADLRSIGRPPKRKSAEIASKMIVNLMSETSENTDAVEETVGVESEYVRDVGRPPKRKCSEIVSKIIEAELYNSYDNEDAVSESSEVVRSPKRKAKTIKEPHPASETIENTKESKTVADSSDKAENRRLASPTKRLSAEKVISGTTENTDTTTADKHGITQTQTMAPKKQKDVEATAKLHETTILVITNEARQGNEVETRGPGRPPKRKSAEVASKIIVDVINDEANKKKLDSLQKIKRVEWFKEFMKFLCSRCGAPFDSNILLTLHFQSCERRCSKFPCGICLNEFPTLLKLKEHLWKIHKPSYEKTVDPSTSPSSSNKSSSTASHSKGSSNVYTCSLCKLALKDRKALILHMSVPHLFRCKKCAFVCATKALMEVHKLKFHKPIQASPTFTNLTSTNGTERKNGEKVRSLRTCRCGIKFSKPSDYEYHKKQCKGNDEAQTVPEQSADQELDDDIVFLECVSTSPNSMDTNNSPAKVSEANSRSSGACNDPGRRKRRQDPLNVTQDYSVICEDKVTESTDEVEPSDRLPNNSLCSKFLEDSSDSNDSRHNLEKPMSGGNPSPQNAECNESLICQECGYLAVSIEDARDHSDSVGNNQSMICDVCAYMANTSCDLKLHSQKNHPPHVNDRVSEPEEPEQIQFSYDPGLAPQYTNENINAETQSPAPVQFEIEFHDSIDMENISSAGYMVAQDIEVRQEEVISYNDNESTAVVLFNISELQNVDQ